MGDENDVLFLVLEGTLQVRIPGALRAVVPVVALNLLRMLAKRVRNDNRRLQDADRMQRKYEKAATVDALTGLRNRRWLNEAFERQLQRTLRSDQPVSVLMIDADHFKHVNDTHGHIVGDEVLVQIGRTLAAGLRPQDLLARYGGEEFAVLPPVTVSIGVATITPSESRRCSS